MTDSGGDPLATSAELIDGYTKPVPVSALRESLVGHFRACLEMVQHFAGPESLLGAIDTPLPNEVRKAYPRHDPQSLLVHTWTARLNEPAQNILDAEQWHLVWANDSLHHFLGNETDAHTASHFSTNDQWPTSLSLQKFFDILGRVSHHEGDRSIPQRFCRALLKCFEMIRGRTANDIEAELQKTSGPLFLDPESPELSSTSVGSTSTRREVDIFLERFKVKKKDSSTRFVVGARAQRPGGIPVSTLTPGRPRWFDFFGVWQLELPSGGKTPIAPEHVVGLQGLFIPADQRHEISTSEQKAIVSAKIAALAARNLSHNLGSHALVQIAGDLDNTLLDPSQPDPSQPGAAVENHQATPTELAAFLRYLAARAELIAMVASGAIYSFSVAENMETIVAPLEKQSLLCRHLCDRQFSLRLAPECYLPVELRAGKLGAQALYAIIENFARNSARHAKRQDAAEPSVYLDIDVQQLPGQSSVSVTLTDLNAAALPENEILRIQGKVQALANQSFANADPEGASADEGQGIREMKAWAAFLAFEPFWQPKCSDLLKFGTNGGRLSMSFCLPLGLPLHVVECSQHSIPEGNSPSIRAPFTLIRMPEASPQKTLEKCTIPGRWVLSCRDQQAPRTPFGPAQHGDRPWQAALQNREADNPDLEVQAVWLDTLKRFAQPDSAAPLHLIIIDDVVYRANVTLSRNSTKDFLEIDTTRYLPDIKVYIVPEPATGANLREFAIRLMDRIGAVGPVAIWDRHSKIVDTITRLEDPDTEALDPLRQQLIHYECDYSRGGYSYIVQNIVLEKKDPAETSSTLFRWLGKLAEAALTRVLIVDERLAALYSKKHSTGLHPLRRAACAGISLFNPNDSVERWPDDLLIHRTSPLALPAQQRIRYAYKTIHESLNKSQAIVAREAIGGNRGDDWVHFVNTWKGESPYLSMHSGRAEAPESTQLNVPTFGLSMLQSDAFDNPCKLALCETLYRGGRSDVCSSCL